MLRKIARRILGESTIIRQESGTDHNAEIAALRAQVDYLLTEVSKASILVRHLAAPTINDFPVHAATRRSFNYQWEGTDDGNWTQTRPQLKVTEPDKVLAYTGLPREWFEGRDVLDAGCGSGRFAWSMASLGANVTAVDQAAAGVEQTRKACAEFGSRVKVLQHDLTRELPVAGPFDLVWSYGVLHHTGDTYGAFRNVARLVKPGGASS